MTHFLIALIASALFAGFLLVFSEEGYSPQHSAAALFGVLMSIACAGGFVVYFTTVIGWHAALHKAEIINREYGTSYTQAEVFYAEDVIDTVREIDRKRVELKGHLLHEEVKE